MRMNNNFFEISEDSLKTSKHTYVFLPKEVLEDRTYSLYLYVEEIDGKLYAKFGEAKDQSCWSRYNGTGMTQNRRMIKVWKSTKCDKEIHRVLKIQSANKHGFKWAGDKENCPLNTSEAYLIQSENGLEKLIDFIQDEVKMSAPYAEDREPWPDVKKLVDEIISSDAKKLNLDLCPRWGKTGTILLLMKELAEKRKIRLNVMTAYVGTVRASYLKEICAIKQNENCKFFDPDDYAHDELVEKMHSWLEDPRHYAMYYVALTGDDDADDTCFARRIKPLEKFKDVSSMLTVEESDFGVGNCHMQISKVSRLEKMLGCKLTIATTGTNAYENETIFRSDKYIKRDYLVDVLNSPCRPDAVHIHWHVLDNAGMLDAGFKACAMENFSSMLEVVNGHLREEMYFESLFTWLFKPAEAVWLKPSFRKNVPINRDAATMVFTAGNKDGHDALKRLLERILPAGWLVQVIDGDETTNKDAENLAKACFAKRNDNHVIFIASGMANRSFSVPQVKNVILLTNGGSFSSIAQKVARGLTSSKSVENVCNVVDFRMSYAADDVNLAKYISSLGIDALNGALSESNEEHMLEMIQASDKLIFDEYFSNGIDPIKTLCIDDIRTMMHSRDFTTAKCEIIFDEIAENVKDPDICLLDEVDECEKALMNANVKGDGGKRLRIKRTDGNAERDGDAPEEEQKKKDAIDKKRQHLLFLLNHAERFNTYRFKTDILKNEFDCMSDARKNAYKDAFGIDMTTMKQIVDLLHEKHVTIL